MRLQLCLTVFLAVAVQFSAQTPDQPFLTFEALYKYGRAEYTTENWSDCIGFMLRAVEDYDFYVDDNLWCRQMCDQQVPEYPRDILSLEDVEILKMGLQYGTSQKALCLLRCRIDKFTAERPPMSDYDVYEAFQDRRPYHYLQFCYWKMGDLKNAIASAFTHLVANPTNKDTVDNLQFYMKQKDYDESMLIDLKQKPYEKDYMDGVAAYNNQEWTDCVDQLSSSIDKFFEEEKKCRYLCDDYLDWGTMQGDNPEMTIVLSSIYASVRRCKYNCLDKLSKVNGHKIKNFLSSYFEYLHVCQFNLQRGRDAAESVANALLLEKSNAMMRRNRLFYAKQYNDESLFTPSERITKFYKQRQLEERYLKFIDTKFHFVDNQLPSEHADDRKPFDIDVDIADDFDYMLIQKALLSKKECGILQATARLPVYSNQFIQHLIDELTTRIRTQYGSAVEFYSLFCPQETSQSGCERGALVIAVDDDRCASLLTDVYNGCAIVFCSD